MLPVFQWLWVIEAARSGDGGGVAAGDRLPASVTVTEGGARRQRVPVPGSAPALLGGSGIGSQGPQHLQQPPHPPPAILSQEPTLARPRGPAVTWRRL